MSGATGSTNGIREGCSSTLDFCTSLLKQAITVDRRGQLLGSTHEAQLKGRSREVLNNLVGAVIGAMLVGYGIYSCINQPGAFNCLSITVTGVTTLLKLKEAAIQSYWRSKEKEEYAIQKESALTSFSLGELAYEYKQITVSTAKSLYSLFCCYLPPMEEKAGVEMKSPTTDHSEPPPLTEAL